MDLHADDDLPVAACAFDEFGWHQRSTPRRRPAAVPRRCTAGALTFGRRFDEAPQGCRNFQRLRAQEPSTGTGVGLMSEWSESVMNDNKARNGALGAILGALIA